ncbi:hypothetical protein SCAR479_08290 [Seiridium cardinale]|uniref:Uncharacterized protein n=1 Tax=Seiridium cardinale TaxID=138064 RepID=A0ABR2XN43_9PEZI
MTTDSPTRTPTSPLWRTGEHSIDLKSSENRPLSSITRLRAVKGLEDRRGSTISLAGDHPRRLSCNINIDRIRTGSIFSVPSPSEASAIEIRELPSDVSRRSSLATADGSNYGDTGEIVNKEHSGLLPDLTQLALRFQLPILAAVISYLALWALNSGGFAKVCEIRHHACQFPMVPAIASHLPIDLCSLPPLPESTFVKILEAQSKYEKIFKYVDKRAGLPDKLIETARKADAYQLGPLDEAKEHTPQKGLFSHSADYSNVILDLGSFFKQVRETAERLVVANKVAKASLQSAASKDTRWLCLDAARCQTWEVVKVYDTLISSSIAQIKLVVESTDIARKKVEVLEQGIESSDKNTESGLDDANYIEEISNHFKDAHALLELVKDGAGRIRDDLTKLQKTKDSPSDGSLTAGKLSSIESKIALWTAQLEARMRSLEETMQGMRSIEATSASKTFGTIDPLIILTSAFTPTSTGMSK